MQLHKCTCGPLQESTVDSLITVQEFSWGSYLLLIILARPFTLFQIRDPSRKRYYSSQGRPAVAFPIPTEKFSRYLLEAIQGCSGGHSLSWSAKRELVTHLTEAVVQQTGSLEVRPSRAIMRSAAIALVQKFPSLRDPLSPGWLSWEQAIRKRIYYSRAKEKL